MPTTKKKSEASRVEASRVSVVRRLLPADVKVLSFLEFLKEYSPSLPIDHKQELSPQLLELLIAPTDTCTVLHHVCAPKCQEPLHTLIDDVVWLLLQRRMRLKQLGQDLKNALLQGFVPARQGETAPSGMRLGVARSQKNSINENVGFCKTSPTIHQLHSLVGDEVFRLIFVHTRLFLPLPDNVKDKKKSGNYILLCGPPLPNPNYITGGLPIEVSTRKRNGEPCSTMKKRKRRKTTRQSASETTVPKTKNRYSVALGPNDCLSRFSLFYVDTYTPRVGLPKSHIFQKMPKCSPQELLADILSLRRENQNKQRRLRKRLGNSALKLCQDILQSHTKCDYHRSLDRYCALPADAMKGTESSKGEEGSNRLAQLAKAFSPQHRIVSFLTSVLRQVFPLEFWGSEHNFQSFVASVHSFVYLRRRERLANKTLMDGIRVTHVKWLFPDQQARNARRSHEAATRLGLLMLRWVFRGFLIPLLRTNFYVTETEFSAYKVHYYRRPVWALFRSLSLQKFLGGKHFTQLSFPTVRELLQEHQMGVSQLRLLPKATGVRPIAQLSRRQSVSFLWENDSAASTLLKKRGEKDIKTQESNKRQKQNDRSAADVAAMVVQSTAQRSSALHFLPTNVVLGEVFDVLRHECSSLKRPFGAGMDSLELFYPRYRDYITRTRDRHKSNKNFRLFIASVDIEKCFDRIDQGTLLAITKNLLSHNSYIIQSVKLHTMTSDGITKEGETRVRFKKAVEPLDRYQSLHHGQQMLGGHSIVFDLSDCALAERKKVQETLQEHISNNVVVTTGRFGKKFLLQTSGISQGSKLSTTLCNVYYGKVEDMMFDEQTTTESQSAANDFVSRFVDDFLFLSTDQNSVERFMSNAYRGVPELGAQVNPEKSSSSTQLIIRWKDADGDTKDMEIQNGCRDNPAAQPLFPWCGLLFNANSGEVSIDYNRFRGEKPLDSLTVDCAGREGTRIKHRMQNFVFPRCLPILFDPSINSFNTTVFNFIQIMLFAAVKTAEYLRSLIVVSSKNIHNIDFIIQSIQALPVVASRNIISKASFAKPERRNFKFKIGHSLSNWLTWKAFHTVFSSLSDFPELKRGIAEQLQPFDSLQIPNNQKLSVCCAVSQALESFCLKEFIKF